MLTFKKNKRGWLTALGVLASAGLLLTAPPAQAGAREQAKRMHDRIAGVPPTDTELNAMLAIMDTDSDGETDSESAAREAAALAMDAPAFYNVTLKNLFTPWSNEEQDVFADLNDFTATLIGLVRDGRDFREALYNDIIYVGNVSPGYSAGSNDHYVALQNSGAHLGDETVLLRRSQSEVTGLPSAATAGVMTTRAAAKAYFVDGTNRAMLRFTLLNFLCSDLEELKDTSLVPDRIRQDVTRSPGGDSRIFMNNCVGCHTGMDPLAQAYAYYDWTGEEGEASGQIQYTAGTVQEKYLINAENFRYGYVTPDDRWDNYWREGQNSALGWDTDLPGSGQGAKSMGMELAHSNAFAQCQARQVFQTVCLHAPATADDHAQVASMVSGFRAAHYNMQNLFTDAAVYCRGE